MADKDAISGRKLRREAVEEQLAPGESIRVVKEGGKTFVLSRTDAGTGEDINAGLDRLIAEMPPEGDRVQTDLARIIVEDRE
jgi:hypothetical protein